jgi:hypothetical protein
VSRLWNDAVLKSEQGKEMYFFFKTLNLVFAHLAFYSMGKGGSFPTGKSACGLSLKIRLHIAEVGNQWICGFTHPLCPHILNGTT